MSSQTEQTRLIPSDESQDEETERPRSSRLSKHIGSYLSSSLQNLQTSERNRITNLKKVGAAAFLVRDAVLIDVENPANGAYDPYANESQHMRNTISIICRRVCSYRPFLSIMYIVSWILVLLTFFEPPHWCRYRENAIPGVDASTTAGMTCSEIFSLEGIPADQTTEEVQLYPNWISHPLSMKSSREIEISCILLLSIFISMRIGRDGLSLTQYLRRSRVQYSRIIELTAISSLIIGIGLDRTQYNPYARLAILLSSSPGTQRDIEVLISMLPEVFNILAILGVLMVFYAWFGTVMFLGTDEGSMHFSSLIESLWTLWICVTTANYPDVMMPAFNNNRWSNVYFVSFMIISFFFLMNLVLAAVFNEYQNAFEERKQDREDHSQQHLRQAFTLLASKELGGIDRETIMSLFYILNEDFPELRNLSSEDTTLLFAILDRDGSSAITEEEFLDFGSVLLLDFVKTSEYATMVERRFPRIFVSPGYQTFCRMIKSAWFEYIVDIVLVLNAIVIGIQSYPELVGSEVNLDPKYWDGSIDTIWEQVETLFTLIYMLEAVLKILVLGRKRYFESVKNVFDFTITMLAAASSAYVYYPNEYSDSRLVRMIVMVRALRLFRLLSAMKRFQLIGTISVQILPAAASIFILLFCMMYLFAAIGVQLYGGLVTRDPSNSLSYLILDTDFSDNDYWANNFNDMLSAMNVLFNLLVVNNWTECEVGFEAVTQSRWVRLYFFAFHICGVVLVNNLVIAFIMNAFFQELGIFQERTGTEIVGEGEAVLQNRAALFDASEVTGTKTSLTGGYIARLRHTYSDIGDGHEQDRLRKLFTHGSSSSHIST